MEKRLIQALIRVVQSQEAAFPVSDALLSFHADYQLGILKGRTRIAFTEAQKGEIAALLRSVSGIDARSIRLEDWQDATRAEALNLGYDEKLARRPVKRNRISVKALPEYPLRLNGKHIELFPGAHLDVAWDTLISIGHKVVLLVENYECFNGLNKIAGIDTLVSQLATEPLVVYRGDPNESRLDNVMRFLADKALPVILFGDYDPASLMEAARFQNGIGMLIPTGVEAVLERFGNAELYRRQIGADFEQLSDDRRQPIIRLYESLQTTRKGLPQEKLVGSGIAVEFCAF